MEGFCAFVFGRLYLLSTTRFLCVTKSNLSSCCRQQDFFLVADNIIFFLLLTRYFVSSADSLLFTYGNRPGTDLMNKHILLNTDVINFVIKEIVGKYSL